MNVTSVDYLLTSAIFGLAAGCIFLGAWQVSIIAVAAWCVAFGMKR